MIPAHIEHVFKALERRELLATKDGGISQEYFMARVNKTDSCWLWTGSSDRKGYGKAHFWDGSRRRYRLAHRVSYEMFVAPLEAGKDVCHRCDVPACVNPQHLFLGTRADNVLDCALKDRLPGAKLTIPEVHEIRRELAAGVGYKELARRYRVRAKAIRLIANREKWKHVSEPQQPMPVYPALVEGSSPTAGIGTADAGTSPIRFWRVQFERGGRTYYDSVEAPDERLASTVALARNIGSTCAQALYEITRAEYDRFTRRSP